MRVARPVELNKQERSMLEQIARGRSLPARLVERARIVLRAAAGMQDQQIAAQLGITPEKAARWRNRYLDRGIEGLEKDESRPGRPRTITSGRTAEVIHKTTQEKPFNATHWSTRTMAAATGLSETTIRYLACQRPEAPSGQDFQSQQRCSVRREVGSHRGALSQPAGTRHRFVRRREEPDSGAGPDAARLTHEKGAVRDDDSRLQAEWDRHSVRRHGRLRRDCDQHVR